MKIRLCIARALCSILAAALPLQSHAFKIDTHLWIGQQVFNDVADDGKITVNLNGRPVSIAVPADVRDAILANKNEFLLGNIGPDAAPDVLVGQVLVHPGNAAGWKTNDWLNYLLQASASNPAGKAFTYGYLGHASADVFAHTYVNQYAGDIFNLTAGEQGITETLVEQRHIALEAYISKFLPKFVDPATGSSEPYEWVKPSDKLGNFVRDALIYPDAPYKQHEAGGTASAHLVALRYYREAINSVAENSIWAKIDVAIIKYFWDEYVGEWSGIYLTDEEAMQLREAIGRLNAAEQDKNDEVQAALTNLNSVAASIDHDRITGTLEVVKTLNDLEAELFEARRQYESLLLTQLCPDTRPSCPTVQVPAVCTKKVAGINVHYPCSRDEEEPRCVVAREVIFSQCKAVNELKSLRDNAAANVLAKKNKVAERIAYTLHRLVDSRTEALKMANALFDAGQVPLRGASPIQERLRGWRADVDTAMGEYVKATNQSMLNTLMKGGSALTPLTTWYECYHLAMVSLPLSVTDCKFRNSAQKMKEMFITLANLPADVLADAVGATGPSQIMALWDQTVAQAIQRVQKEVGEAVLKRMPDQLQALITVLHDPIDDAFLRKYFTKPEAGSAPLRLLMIPDIVERVQAEMGVKNGYLDPVRFAALNNAVVLAKLALLDNAGLNQLAAAAGVGTAGQPLFNPTVPSHHNVMAHAFASIDGNHQWMEGEAPPRPSTLGAIGQPYRIPKPGKNPGEYPYQYAYASANGFVPWRQARVPLFLGLFSGPISPALESPKEIGFPAILPANYPYRSCKANPFPASVNDHTCALISILPKLMD